MPTVPTAWQSHALSAQPAQSQLRVVSCRFEHSHVCILCCMVSDRSFPSLDLVSPPLRVVSWWVETCHATRPKPVFLCSSRPRGFALAWLVHSLLHDVGRWFGLFFAYIISGMASARTFLVARPVSAFSCASGFDLLSISP